MNASDQTSNEIEELEREGRVLIYEANRPLLRGFGHAVSLGIFGALVAPVLLIRFFEDSGWIEALILAVFGFFGFYVIAQNAIVYASKRRFHLGMQLLWMARVERRLAGGAARGSGGVPSAGDDAAL